MADEITILVRAEDAFSSVLGNFGNIMTGIKSTIDLVGSAFRTLGGFAMEGLDAIASYERMGAALTSLTASQILQTGAVKDMATAMEMAAPKAEELLGWIQQVAIKSPFTSEGVAQAFRMAEAYGFSADESKRLVQALIDFAAGTGASEDSMRRITLALGQISATGKVTGGDMLQLVNAGLPVTQILADGFGVTTAKIMEMRSQGLLPATESIEYITQYLENNFRGAAEAQANTWAGLLGTFQDLKAIGLREFFGGLFDALQPLAVSLSTWLQGPGMVIIGTLGDMLGTVTSNLTAKLGEFAPVFNTLNSAFLEFRNLINDDWTPLQALYKVLGDLAIVWNGTPLGNVVTQIQEFIQTGQSEGWGIAIKNLFTDVTSGFDLQATVQGILDKITNALGGSDLTPLGQTIGNVLSGAIKTVFDGLDIIINQVDWAPAGLALKTALGEMWKGAIQNTDLTSTVDSYILKPIIQFIKDNWYRILFPMVPNSAQRQQIYAEFSKVAQSAIDGLVNGMNSIEINITNWIRDRVVNPVKQFLGIASPSTVFFQIGKDIIQGLINGISSMTSFIIDGFRTLIDKILKLPGFKQIAEVLGINTSSAGSSGGFNMPGDDSRFDTGSGTTGGKPGSGGTGTSTTGTGGVVNYNFYGPVYMSGVPAEGSYDCPPNPIIQSGSNQVIPIGVH